MASGVEIDELMSRAILVYLGMEQELVSLPRNSRSRLDEVFGPELAAGLWERLLPFIRSFGSDEPILTEGDRQARLARAKKIFRERPRNRHLSVEEADQLFVERNVDPLNYVARDRNSQVAGENEAAVARALAESQERFPQLSDMAHEAMGRSYGYSLWKDGYGRV